MSTEFKPVDLFGANCLVLAEGRKNLLAHPSEILKRVNELETSAYKVPSTTSAIMEMFSARCRLVRCLLNNPDESKTVVQEVENIVDNINSFWNWQPSLAWKKSEPKSSPVSNRYYSGVSAALR